MRGGGKGRPFDGVVQTELTSLGESLHFPSILLAPVLIMGYPTFSTYHPGAFDLFKLSNGYSYTREFDFQNNGRMETRHKVVYCGDHLTGDFEVINADVDLPDIIACEPTIETFVPNGPGSIASHFMMAWLTKDGSIFTTKVRSVYSLTHNVSIPYMQFRYITFDGVYSDDNIKQTEKLNVFRDIRRLSFPQNREI